MGNHVISRAVQRLIVLVAVDNDGLKDILGAECKV